MQQFLDELERLYGTRHPIFLRMSYNDALSEARKDLKFLLVYLHSDDHQDTPRFCRLVKLLFEFFKNNNLNVNCVI